MMRVVWLIDWLIDWLIHCLIDWSIFCCQLKLLICCQLVNQLWISAIKQEQIYGEDIYQALSKRYDVLSNTTFSANWVPVLPLSQLLDLVEAVRVNHARNDTIKTLLISRELVCDVLYGAQGSFCEDPIHCWESWTTVVSFPGLGTRLELLLLSFNISLISHSPNLVWNINSFSSTVRNSSGQKFWARCPDPGDCQPFHFPPFFPS